MALPLRIGGCLGLAILVLVALGCRRLPSGLSGPVTVDGSSTVYPITEAIASRFYKVCPDVDVTVAVSGTGGGFKRFTRGELDISGASRPIRAAEFVQCAASGVAFLELPVAYDGLTFVVHPSNTWMTQLTIEQLRRIFLDPPAPRTWKQVHPEWPDLPIKIYAPGTDSGTFDYFRQVIVGDDPGRSIRSDLSTNEDDNVLVTGVAGEREALGFFGAAYYYENREKLRAVPIVNPETGKGVLPTPEAIESGRYAPFSRPLFLYVRTTSLHSPQVRKFVEFYLEDASRTASSVGYVPLSPELYARSRRHLSERLAGTHYLSDQGEILQGSLSERYREEDAYRLTLAEAGPGMDK